MDISNTISIEPHTSVEPSENRIRQDAPQIIQNTNFKTRLDDIDKINNA